MVFDICYGEMMEIDDIDRKMIHCLAVDGRASFSEIAAVLGVSDHTVARRYRRLRSAGVFRVVGLRANPGQSNYAAAKAGLIQFTRTAAVEVARRGVTINAVAPGWIETDMTADVDTELLSAVPAKRAGSVSFIP